MFKLTERIGGIELTYEAETVEGVVALKNAVNPHVIVVKEPPQGSLKEAVERALKQQATLRPTY